MNSNESSSSQVGDSSAVESEPVIEFESVEEKMLLFGAMTSTAVNSLVGAVLVKRYPKWGYRYMVLHGVFASMAAVAFHESDVNTTSGPEEVPDQ